MQVELGSLALRVLDDWERSRRGPGIIQGPPSPVELTW